jgi:hypothetical protein
LPQDLKSLPAWPFADDRMDAWVFKVGIAIPLVFIAALGLWHLIVYLAGRLPKKPRPVKHSPEPPSAMQVPKLLPRVQSLAEIGPAGDDPERLQQACSALEDSLAGVYMKLAESWLRRGQPQKAAAAMKKVLLICPEGQHAQLAQDRLHHMSHEGEDHPT